MKKIINKKTYDTETAKPVCVYSYVFAGDFRKVTETLYRKKTGEYFLHGIGGPASKYPKETIIPMVASAAEVFMIKCNRGANRGAKRSAA